MKRIFTLMLLLSVMTIASAQKMTIKTASGQIVEINCDGMQPAEVQVEGDKVTFKMSKVDDVAENVAEADSLSMPNLTVQEDIAQNEDGEVADTMKVDATNLTADSKQSALGFFANSLAEELSPEYAAFNKEHEGDTLRSEKEVIKDVAKQFVNEDVVETVDLLGSMFKYLRFTKDTTFVAKYEQRKPKKAWRTYDIIELSGNLGKDIRSAAGDAAASEINADDYGDDAENDHKYGGGIKYSHVYIKGSEDTNGQWQPNPLGLAWSWGGLLAYNYEKDMGSSISAMGKVGMQIGSDIAFGVDALFGCGITPYAKFLTNGINHALVNRSTFCLKYGVQLWGSLNFSKNTYTTIYGRYVYSKRPKSDENNLPRGWDVIFEDYDPSSWTVGLAVGYKFGAPQQLSQDKRLQASLSAGYQLIGQKGIVLSSEIERLTQVSKSTTLTYGLAVEELFAKGEEDNDTYTSILFSGGFKVKQPFNSWFWGAKLYAGLGDCEVNFAGKATGTEISNSLRKLSAKTAIQLSTGFHLNKTSEIFAACRLGYHFTSAIDTENLDSNKSDNLNGFDLSTHLGYKLTF